MGVTKNWLSNIPKDKMKEFFEMNFYVNSNYFSTEFDEEYGVTYLCHTDYSLLESTGEESYSVQIGNFGLVKTQDNATTDARIVDDFVLAKYNRRAFIDYIKFVAENNIVDGEPVKIGGLTYQEMLNISFNNFIESLSCKNKIFGNNDKKEAAEKDKRVYRDVLKEANKELDVIFANEVEPGQE